MMTRRQLVSALGSIVVGFQVVSAQDAKRERELATVTLVIDGMT